MNKQKVNTQKSNKRIIDTSKDKSNINAHHIKDWKVLEKRLKITKCDSYVPDNPLDYPWFLLI